MDSTHNIVQEKPFSYWLHKNKYYHRLMRSFYQYTVPQGSVVLHVGCKDGHLLKNIRPSHAVGVETDAYELSIAQDKHPQYVFKNDITEVKGTFDYIILSSSYIMELDDIQKFFESLKKFCTPETRIVIDWHSTLWEPMLKILQKIGLRRPTLFKNWISRTDMKNFLYLAGFDEVTSGQHILFPLYIPVFSWIVNSFIAIIPGINKLCVNNWLVARVIARRDDVSVSVIITCRNERGNIEAAVQRCPDMGIFTELIFVEGHSYDGTLAEIKRVAEKYPEKNIKILVQPGKGKGDAVRYGFAHAQGDLFMILDGDLTMPPEDLPKFYNAYVEGKADFVNGSRLVYGMESQAMQFLNLIANYCFGIGFSWILGQKIKDTLCGTKVLHKDAYARIVKNRSFFGEFDPFGDFDLLFGAAKQNMKIVDVPIRYKSRVYGSTNIRRFYHGMLLLRMSFIGFCKFKLRI